jgi:ArsR family transcriptional regulator
MSARLRDLAACGTVLIGIDDNGAPDPALRAAPPGQLRQSINTYTFIDMPDAAAGLLRLLGDESRLRLLRVLAREPLNVTELTAVLGLAQSGISRHLGLLREAGLVEEERSGAFAWYRLSPSAADGADARASLWRWLKAEFERATPAARADDARLEEVRRLRKEDFARHGGEGERRQMVPGRSWAAWARALGLLLPPLDVADVGCGEGYLTLEMARWARRVVAIDRSPEVLARGRELAARRRLSNIVWKRGLLERLPMRAGSVDLVLLSQALHHAEDPVRALAEVVRVLRPDGRLLLLDLREHGESWVRAKLGDRWLGFDPAGLRAMCTAAGFESVNLQVGSRRMGDPFVVLIGSARKTSRKAKRTA